MKLIYVLQVLLFIFAQTLSLTTDEYNKVIQLTMQRQNMYRSWHRVPPLILNNTISIFSQNYSRHLASINKLVHSYNPNYGENLFYDCEYLKIPNITYVGSVAVDAFYDEISLYNFSNPIYDHSSGHFTQLVWKGSTQCGIGISISNRIINNYTYECAYIVINYWTYGNYNTPEAYRQNVLPPLDAPSSTTSTSTTQYTSKSTSKPSSSSISRPQISLLLLTYIFLIIINKIN